MVEGGLGRSSYTVCAYKQKQPISIYTIKKIPLKLYVRDMHVQKCTLKKHPYFFFIVWFNRFQPSFCPHVENWLLIIENWSAISWTFGWKIFEVQL